MTIFEPGDLCEYDGEVFIITSDICDCFGSDSIVTPHWHIDATVCQGKHKSTWTSGAFFTANSIIAEQTVILSRASDDD